MKGRGRSVAVVKVEGMIDGGLAAFMERAIKEAEAIHAAAFVIEMNTYGGRVDAADEIRTVLLNTSLPTITYIHNNAASAGALISYATDVIVMSPGSAIGAATPVDQTGAVASNKVVSYFRTIMGETARAKGRDPRIAEAMVDSSVAVPGLEQAPRPLTLRTDQAIEFHVAHMQATSLTEALRFNALEGAKIVRIETNWAEHVVRFLTHPVVSGLLMTIGALGVIYELTSPGFGLPGIAGVTCLALFFGAHWIVKLAQVEELLLFIAGLGLLVAEVFVPGGILGIVGGALVLAGLFLSLLGRIDLMSPGDLSNAFTSIGTAVVLTFVGILVLVKSFSQLPMFRRLTLSTKQQPGTGHAPIVKSEHDALIGATGAADSPLRPSGRVTIDGKYHDAVTDGEHIAAGTPIKVIGVSAIRGLVVRRA
jgi:membrane-bound serine protease (ClpP class)